MIQALRDGRWERYRVASDYLAGLDDDWAGLVGLIGPCRHDPKAAREPYEALVRAIAYQQLHAKAGDAILDRLRAMVPGHPFPLAGQLLALSDEALRGCGFSGNKVATIRQIASGSLSGLVPGRHEAIGLSDRALIDRLVTIKGIGRWTVEMLLMYSLERTDIMPAQDFGVGEGYRRLRKLRERPTARALRDLSQMWSPHRTVATWYLWQAAKQLSPDCTAV